MVGKGIWKVYFNRHQEATRVWCVAPVSGAWEAAVVSVDIFDGDVLSRYKRLPNPDPELLGPPSAWMEVEGALTLYDNGMAVIRGAQ
jgi:hypothetical protein